MCIAHDLECAYIYMYMYAVCMCTQNVYTCALETIETVGAIRILASSHHYWNMQEFPYLGSVPPIVCF